MAAVARHRPTRRAPRALRVDSIGSHGRPGPAALVFDAYGTLFDAASVADACTGVAPDPAAFVALWRQKQLEYTWLRNSMRRYADFETVTADALDHVAERLDVPMAPDARARLLDAWLRVRPFADAAGALGTFRGRLRLAILSNGTPRMLAAALDAAELRGHFDAVLSVEAVGVYKPDPGVYALAPRALRLDPSRLLFVSANGWDIAGATAAGLPAVYLNRAGVPPDRLGLSNAVTTVPGLAELARIVDPGTGHLPA